jgi:serine/threonine-protein kinase
MTGPVIGFPWWLMWLPVCVAIGFDAVIHPNSLWGSMAIGIPGMAISLWLYLRVLNSKKRSAVKWQKSFAGESLSKAYQTLEEIERARID